MVDRVHLFRIGIKPVRMRSAALVAQNRAILPGGKPQLIGHFQKFIGALITAVMIGLALQPQIARGAFQL